MLTWDDDLQGFPVEFEVDRKVGTQPFVNVATVSSGSYLDEDYVFTTGAGKSLTYRVRTVNLDEEPGVGSRKSAYSAISGKGLDAQHGVKALSESNPTAQNVTATNYPNPFNPSTTVTYEMPENGQVVLKVYNIIGEEVTTLVNGWKQRGSHKAHWDGTSNNGRMVASGIYFSRITVKTLNGVRYARTKKMLLQR